MYIGGNYVKIILPLLCYFGSSEIYVLGAAASHNSNGNNSDKAIHNPQRKSTGDPYPFQDYRVTGDGQSQTEPSSGEAPSYLSPDQSTYPKDPHFGDDSYQTYRGVAHLNTHKVLPKISSNHVAVQTDENDIRWQRQDMMKRLRELEEDLKRRRLKQEETNKHTMQEYEDNRKKDGVVERLRTEENQQQQAAEEKRQREEESSDEEEDRRQREEEESRKRKEEERRREEEREEEEERRKDEEAEERRRRKDEEEERERRREEEQDEERRRKKEEERSRKDEERRRKEKEEEEMRGRKEEEEDRREEKEERRREEEEARREREDENNRRKKRGAEERVENQGEEVHEDESGHLGAEKKSERSLLVAGIERMRRERRELELKRDEYLRRAKTLQSGTRGKANFARDAWKKKYFEEKKKTPPLENEALKNWKNLETMYNRVVSTINVSKDDVSPKYNEIRVEAAKAQFGIDDMQRKVENLKMKLTTEMKLRNQAQKELRHLKAELAQKKQSVDALRYKNVSLVEAMPENLLLTKTTNPEWRS